MTAATSVDARPEIRRGFVDVDPGQVHYRCAGDAGLPPLVMLHKSPGSSFSLMPMMAQLATRRRVYALDTPGNGDSSPLAKRRPEIADYAETQARAVAALGLERFDLYGFHTGVNIAIEMAIAHPQRVRRLILEGVGLYEAAEVQDLMEHDHVPALQPDLHGGQFLSAWHMVRDGHLFWPWWDRRAAALRGRGLPSADQLHGEVLEVMKALRTYHLSYRAALRFRKRERLPLVTVPTLVTAAPKDQLFGYLDAAAALVPGAESAIVPGTDTEDDLRATADMFLLFLDGGRETQSA